MDDLKIIELYNARSESALAQTAEKYGAYLNHIAYSVLQSREDSEECVSDAYLKTWNAIPPAKPANLKAFIAKITRNSAIDRLSSENAEKRGGGQMELCLEELEECVPGGELESREITELIDAYLKTQKPQNQKMFIRRYWYMDSIKDVAFACNCGESKVKTALFRMRGELKSVLTKEGIEI